MSEEIIYEFNLDDLKMVRHLKNKFIKRQIYESAAIMRDVEKTIEARLKKLNIPFSEKTVFDADIVKTITTKKWIDPEIASIHQSLDDIASRLKLVPVCEHEGCKSEKVYQFMREKTDAPINNIIINLCQDHRGSHRLAEMIL